MGSWIRSVMKAVNSCSVQVHRSSKACLDLLNKWNHQEFFAPCRSKRYHKTLENEDTARLTLLTALLLHWEFEQERQKREHLVWRWTQSQKEEFFFPPSWMLIFILLPLWHWLFSPGETVCSSLLSPVLALLQITVLTTYIISYLSMAISSCPQQKASAPLLTIFHLCIDRYRMTKAYEIMNNAMKAPWIFLFCP